MNDEASVRYNGKQHEDESTNHDEWDTQDNDGTAQVPVMPDSYKRVNQSESWDESLWV